MFFLHEWVVQPVHDYFGGLYKYIYVGGQGCNEHGVGGGGGGGATLV